MLRNACTSQFSNRFVIAAAPHSGTPRNIGLQRVEASDLTLPTRFSVRGRDEIPMDRIQTTRLHSIFKTVIPKRETQFTADSLHHIVFWKNIADDPLQALHAADRD